MTAEQIHRGGVATFVHSFTLAEFRQFVLEAKASSVSFVQMSFNGVDGYVPMGNIGEEWIRNASAEDFEGMLANYPTDQVAD